MGIKLEHKKHAIAYSSYSVAGLLYLAGFIAGVYLGLGTFAIVTTPNDKTPLGNAKELASLAITLIVALHVSLPFCECGNKLLSFGDRQLKGSGDGN